MIDLDPKIVDQETVRKNKRKRMLKIAVLPCILIIILALMAFRQSAYNAFFGLVIKNNEAEFGNVLTQMQLFSNYAEPYIAHYNEGIVRVKNGHYSEAEQSFRTSLENNPPEAVLCDIYNNLAVSIELRADELVKTSTYRSAIELYTQSESILYSSGCASKTGKIKDKKSGETARRISEKRSEAIAKMNAFTSENGSNYGNNSQAVSDDKIDELKKQQAEQNSIVPSIRNAIGGEGSESATPW